MDFPVGIFSSSTESCSAPRAQFPTPSASPKCTEVLHLDPRAQGGSSLPHSRSPHLLLPHSPNTPHNSDKSKWKPGLIPREVN